MACTINFRNLNEGFDSKTYKHKRQEVEAAIVTATTNSAMEVDDVALPSPIKRSVVLSSDDPDKPAFRKPTYDGVIARRVSGQKWKQVRTQRASEKHVSMKGTSFEERERQKEIKRAYRERLNELKEEIRRNKVKKRKMREETEKKKQENTLRSGAKLLKMNKKIAVEAEGDNR